MGTQHLVSSWTDPFQSADGRPRVLRGTAILSRSLSIAEMAARLGFDTVWLEVEHGGASFSEIEALCMAAESGGAIPTVRLPDHHRHHILRALEAGGRIIIVPMVNNAEIAREIVQHGKFPPLGARGFNTRSRGFNYGLDGMTDMQSLFRAVNDTTHLIAQIETKEAVENLDAICAVEGLSGILIGPGDLSVSYGKTAAFTDPEYIALVADIIRRAKAAGKHAGILVAPGLMLDAVRAAGCDFFYCAGDVNDLARAWRAVLEATQTAA